MLDSFIRQPTSTIGIDWLFILAGLLALADWAVHWRKEWTTARWFTKPGVMILLITWSLLNGGWRGQMVWFGLGLVLSLAGDVFLMLPHHWFRRGLAAFLLAHVAYVIGFNAGWVNNGHPLNVPIYVPIGLLVAFLGVAAWFYTRLYLALKKKAYGKEMQIPVGIYMATIVVMVISAICTNLRPDWPWQAAMLAGGGAILFAISDSMLAVNRFVRPLPKGQVWVHVTYHLGQAAILLGATLAYVQRWAG